MPAMLLRLSDLGAIERNGTVTFGLWLPWVSAAEGNAVSVKIIHEHDQFQQQIGPSEFSMTHSVRAPYGDFWSVTVPISGSPPPTTGSAWGTEGRYLYRYRIDNPHIGSVDWIIDPCAREFGLGKLSAFTLGYQPYTWSASESTWQVPQLVDLVLYEINIAEFGGSLDQANTLMAYLADLGVNAIICRRAPWWRSRFEQYRATSGNAAHDPVELRANLDVSVAKMHATWPKASELSYLPLDCGLHP